jgi:hypothetical protein
MAEHFQKLIRECIEMVPFLNWPQRQSETAPVFGSADVWLKGTLLATGFKRIASNSVK